jgi:mono/diheme cytochrome c family protein
MNREKPNLSRTLKFAGVITITLGLLGGCGESPAPQPATGVPEAENGPGQNRFDMARISRGALLYQQHCAECHGPEAQGHPDWKNARKLGFSAAPPLDGTGPASTRKKSDLVTIIRNGVQYEGKPVMPAWRGRVTDEDIENVILWFQALWPSQVYANWHKLND